MENSEKVKNIFITESFTDEFFQQQEDARQAHFDDCQDEYFSKYD